MLNVLFAHLQFLARSINSHLQHGSQANTDSIGSDKQQSSI